MPISLSQVIAVIDGAIAVAEAVANLTPSEKDNEYVAALKAYRERFRPIFGADGECAAEDLPQAVADVIDLEAGRIEVSSDES